MVATNALELINRAVSEKRTSLSFSDVYLTKLPPEIGLLTDLVELNLDNNGLASLPPEIGGLTRLTKLSIKNNRLGGLPDEISNLKNLDELVLDFNLLTRLPDAIGDLVNLKTLSVRENRLSAINRRIGDLSRLSSFDAFGNSLTTLPPEIGRLSSLSTLDLSRNQLKGLPPEIGGLGRLKSFDLSLNQLTSLPKEIGQLAALASLNLSENQLTALPAEVGGLAALESLSARINRLTALPKEIAGLTALRSLDLYGNQLTALPAEVGDLAALESLCLYGNQLTALPAKVGGLAALKSLNLYGNQLTALPAEVGGLTALKSLNLSGNLLTALPAEVGDLTALESLNLSGNQLTALPAEVGGLAALESLNLVANQLLALPRQIGGLAKLSDLKVGDNPNLADPPPDIISQGSRAILSYLAAFVEQEEQEQWVSKLLVVGQGGVGKTALLRALRGEPYVEGSPATKGIEIGTLEYGHPSRSDVRMVLTTWDFAGQEINQATHQFFLTNRSLFILAWNARQGYGQGRIEYWLDTIHARAPESPILLVATHTDLWPPDIPFEELRRKYPQIAGRCEISSKTGDGLPELQEAVGAVAAGLPLMGERWPTKWLDAANELRALGQKQNYIHSVKLFDILQKHGVTGAAANTLARWLHELGDLLFFQEEESLRDLVILQPRWVTEAISRVLSCPEVKQNIGIFTKDDMLRLWHDIDPFLKDHLLNLMEMFDLSYKTKEDRDISLIVELLQTEAPDFREAWEAVGTRPDYKEISMTFDLNPSSLPAGVPTWFIARQHRFTTRTHWRHGALFADGPAREHLGLIQASPHERLLRLTVRGPFPQTFFALLRDGLEVTLGRFPGLKIKRKVPCAGHASVKCQHLFDLDHLRNAIDRDPPVLEIQCPDAFEQVSVAQLLFGIPWRFSGEQDDRIRRLEERVDDKLIPGIHDLRALAGKSLVELREQRALIEREFTRAFRRDQRFEESHCPNVFTVRPLNSSKWKTTLAGQSWALQLYCQQPGHWHPVGEPYTLNQPAKWLQTIAPHVRRLVKILQFSAPLLVPGAAFVAPDVAAILKKDLDLMNALVKALPEIESKSGPDVANLASSSEGAALRELRALLEDLDPRRLWGGLKKVHTPEGDYLWLCGHHCKKYE